jgi:hypothetical protein
MVSLQLYEALPVKVVETSLLILATDAAHREEQGPICFLKYPYRTPFRLC